MLGVEYADLERTITMIDALEFKAWLKENTSYSDAVVGDIVSRMKRSDKLLQWYDDDVYLFRLTNDNSFKTLSVSVRSQMKRAVVLYNQYKHSLD